MFAFQKRALSGAIAAGFIAISTPAAADEDVTQIRQQLDELDQKIRVLQRLQEIDKENASAKAKEVPGLKAGASGFGLQSADGAFEFRLRGLLQVDYRDFQQGTTIATQGASGASTAGYLTNEEARSGFLLRRVRPTFEGTLFGKYDFRFTPEYGDGKSQVIDAYADARLAPWFKVRAGKYKPFVSLERLQSGADLKFVERGYASSALLPNRDLGVSIYGDVLGKKLNYAIGVHNGVPDGGDTTTGSDSNSDKDFAARLFATPFTGADHAFAGLGFGVAATYGNVRGRVIDTVNGSSTELTSGYKTEGQQTFFRYIDGSVLRSGVGGSATDPNVDWLVHADGERLRIAPQASYYYGPFGLLAEYAQVKQEVSIGRTNSSKTTLKHTAWSVGGSWLLTGEDASFRSPKPKQNFEFGKPGWGAWELVARFSKIELDDDTFVFGTSSGATVAALNTTPHWLYADPKISSKSAETIALGVNWYVNPNVRVGLDYAQTAFEGGGGPYVPPGVNNSNNAASITSNAAAADREDERVLLARFQVAF